MKKATFVCLVPAFLAFGLFSCSDDPEPGNSGAVPVLTTTNVNIVTQYTAGSGGNVTSDASTPVTARGICWSTATAPTTSDSKTTNGAGNGSFTSTMTGLLPQTKYYVRSYGTNSKGTAYGNEFSFTTLGESETSVTDIDGNVYEVVIIGSQTWMKSNLKTTRYSNGDTIPTGLSNTAWGTATTGAFAIYNNDQSSHTTYGKLYNWFAAADSRKIAPQGWHVPSDEERSALVLELGESLVAGGALKEAGLAHWISPNEGATNSSGFTGLPGGTRMENGEYSYIGNGGYWWTTTTYSGNPAEAEAQGLFAFTAEGNQITGLKVRGASIRCIKD
ncbi:fibrobacter succinogenes major paralogous domain-containing protein [Flavihumibacter petaseus]|uniref:Fibrobacter succinogenes major paralogous domain-containing protein n=1 Tax=Flavihumibacter petaseus NBRC 106054 TaxID=1220578 RepID=A0A0E9MUP4_9BACT|nr:fibrobacter succinogenes major paralogous domain-containing protein [Flavihumibacter petaseus]GAO41462.1 hypothetical protein FPE01S_01_04750 [Flavihumibacter petaseus NBRC 106054]